LTSGNDSVQLVSMNAEKTARIPSFKIYLFIFLCLK
jgi:hypothetical protein